MSLQRLMAAVAVGAMLAGPAAATDPGASEPTAERPSESWTEIRDRLFADRTIAAGDGMLSIEAPYRAHDAAMVPIEISVDPGEGRHVRELTLIVDENPAPIAGVFTFGEPESARVELSTRIRVNAYSNVRIVAELDDGSLVQAARFVKASGGCSAPALKDADAALASLGRMKLKQYSTPADSQADGREVQVMLRHPNNSGFQMDQVTQLYVPAWFVDEITVREGERLVLTVSGGISLSEDPSLRFRYFPQTGEALSVEATDTDGHAYASSFPVVGSGS